MNEHESLVERFRLWLAGRVFLFAGWLHPMYRVWLDGAPRREPGDDGEVRDGPG